MYNFFEMKNKRVIFKNYIYIKKLIENSKKIF
jgi:hypothetical protein